MLVIFVHILLSAVGGHSFSSFYRIPLCVYKLHFFIHSTIDGHLGSSRFGLWELLLWTFLNMSFGPYQIVPFL